MMEPRTPAIRLAQALDALRTEVHAALADAEGHYEETLCLGDLVREHRKIANLTLNDLATLAGCNKSHIWEIENRRSRNPTVKTIAGLAYALGLPVMLVFRAALREISMTD